MKYIVITGSSTGIGFACVKKFHQAGFHIFGSVRKASDAEKLSKQFPERFTPLLFDVTDKEAIGKAVEKVKSSIGNQGLAGLINNAGIVVGGPLAILPVDELRRQFEVNVFGLIQVTQLFLPLLGASPDASPSPGRIVNISSVSGKISMPFLGPYSASKYALEALSDSLRRELMLYGIKVIVIGPGAVQTPIWDKGPAADMSMVNGTDYEQAALKLRNYAVNNGKKGMLPETIADVAFKAMTHSSPKTRYAPVYKRFANWTLPRLLPVKRFDRAIAKNLNLLPEFLRKPSK